MPAMNYDSHHLSHQVRACFPAEKGKFSAQKKGGCDHEEVSVEQVILELPPLSQKKP